MKSIEEKAWKKGRKEVGRKKETERNKSKRHTQEVVPREGGGGDQIIWENFDASRGGNF